MNCLLHYLVLIQSRNNENNIVCSKDSTELHYCTKFPRVAYAQGNEEVANRAGETREDRDKQGEHQSIPLHNLVHQRENSL